MNHLFIQHAFSYIAQFWGRFWYWTLVMSDCRLSPPKADKLPDVLPGTYFNLLSLNPEHRGIQSSWWLHEIRTNQHITSFQASLPRAVGSQIDLDLMAMSGGWQISQHLGVQRHHS